ncbi:MAG: hypothetical protein PWP71_284 [Clostridia bacterium]|jgi:hypothetical protein|nr:hypothetical protein [Clostridia bacterium]
MLGPNEATLECCVEILSKQTGFHRYRKVICTKGVNYDQLGWYRVIISRPYNLWDGSFF